MDSVAHSHSRHDVVHMDLRLRHKLHNRGLEVHQVVEEGSLVGSLLLLRRRERV